MKKAVSDGSSRLVEQLRAVPGLELTAGELLVNHTTLRIGGPAEVFARLGTEAALVAVLRAASQTEIPFQLLGLGSNMLIPDCGLAGVVAVLEGDFQRSEVRGNRVEAGAGLSLAKLARTSLERGLVGLEALAGFPSTVGGAVVMNAGSYGVEIKDVLESVDIVRPDGSSQTLGVEQIGAGYRSTLLQGSGAVVVRAILRLRRDDPTPARQRLEELNRRRRRSMPSGKPNAGSVFRNPDGDSAGRLIERCGLKGKRHGGAEISREHANVIVNRGGATAEDVLQLMADAYRAVMLEFGIDLEPEIVLTGPLRERWLAQVQSHSNPSRLRR